MLLVAEVVEDRIVEIEIGEWVTALGRDLDRTKKIHPRSMADTLEALKNCCDIIKKYGLKPMEVLVTATEAARVAINAKDFFRDIDEKLGLRICVITAEGEAYYTFRGVIQNDIDNTTVIMDIGGASTELIKVSGKRLEKMMSLPIGSVRGSEGKIKGRTESILMERRTEMACFQTSQLVGVGGTMTSLAAISKDMKNFEREKIEDYTIDDFDLKNCVFRIEGFSEEQLHKKFPFLGKRVKSIKEGGRLALAIGSILGVQGWKVSTRGLRYGTIRDKYIDERFII